MMAQVFRRRHCHVFLSDFSGWTAPAPAKQAGPDVELAIYPKHIIQAHGGEVRVQSEPQKGFDLFSEHSAAARLMNINRADIGGADDRTPARVAVLQEQPNTAAACLVAWSV